VLGVLGVTACSICINKESQWEITEQSILGVNNKIITQELIKDVDEAIERNKGEFLVRNLKVEPVLGLNTGAFIAISIKRHNKKYGLIAIYYNTLDAFSDSKLEFFRLMSGQLGVYFENAFLFERVSLSSITDGLTGLYNRVHLNKIISNESFSNNKELGIIMADLDNFKAVNDKYGHLFGDTVLKYVSVLFKEIALKYNATAYRYGGEEFLLIFSKTDESDICAAAEEIRDKFSNKKFDIDKEIRSFTLSIGIANMGASSKVINIFKLIDLADEALYIAKNNGKNRYIFLNGNLDLYLKSRDVLIKNVSKYKRFKEPFMIMKIYINIDEFCDVVEYDNSMENISKKFREYDSVFYNYVGEVLVISENYIDQEVIKKKLSFVEKYELETLLYNDDAINIKEFFKLEGNIN
jgi:diguanylate cyclase (GGDEF)-like protein